jgi:hypothetical protein
MSAWRTGALFYSTCHHAKGVRKRLTHKAHDHDDLKRIIDAFNEFLLPVIKEQIVKNERS